LDSSFRSTVDPPACSNRSRFENLSRNPNRRFLDRGLAINGIPQRIQSSKK